MNPAPSPSGSESIFLYAGVENQTIKGSRDIILPHIFLEIERNHEINPSLTVVSPKTHAARDCLDNGQLQWPACHTC